MKLSTALVPAAALGAVLAIALPASAAVTFDATSGAGFVGKGDVQLALNYNNKQLNDNAGALSFAYEGITITETEWVCSRTNPQGTAQTQERARTTTAETSGVVSHATRDNKKQITGFTLTKYSGTVTSSSTTDGPTLGSCPSGWTASEPVTGDPVDGGGGLLVNRVSLQPAPAA